VCSQELSDVTSTRKGVLSAFEMTYADSQDGSPGLTLPAVPAPPSVVGPPLSQKLSLRRDDPFPHVLQSREQPQPADQPPFSAGSPREESGQNALVDLAEKLLR
jgi:hypothetical protein